MGIRVGRFGIGLVLVAGLSMGLAGGAAADEALDRRLADALNVIDAAQTAHDCPKAVRLGEALLVQRRGKLPGKLEAALETLVAGCAYDGKAKEKAYAHALQGTRLEDSPDELWRLRLFIEMDGKKYGAAVATVEAMSQGRGAALNGTPISWLYQLENGMKEAGLKAERKRLLRVLTADGYVPVESLGDTEGFRAAYADALADEGDAAGARAILATLSEPSYLLDALFEPRMAALLPKDLNLQGAAERALAHYRALAEAHPDRLAPIVRASAEMRRLGRPQDSLALLRPVVARPDVASAYTDAGQKLSWVWDEIARSSEMLGRYEDAAKALATGAALREEGAPNVSQVINLAHLQIRFGHPQEALKTLAPFDNPALNASPYGILEMRLARGCAHAAASQPQAAAADLAYAEAHPKDHPEALGYLYLCLGRTDDAAAFFIRGLDDPNRRVQMLQTFSDYDAPLVALPPGFSEKLAILKARPDVKAAIAKAGGIRRIPFQESDL